MDLKKYSASAFNLSRRLFCSHTRPCYTHCLMYYSNHVLSWYLTGTVHSLYLPTERRHRGVHELEQGQTSEIWLQMMLVVVFVMNLSVQSMNQCALMMLSKLFPGWFAAKMMSLDQENPPSPYIYSPYLPTLLTISTTFDTPSSPLLPCCITLDNWFNTPSTCLE